MVVFWRLSRIRCCICFIRRSLQSMFMARRIALAFPKSMSNLDFGWCFRSTILSLCTPSKQIFLSNSLDITDLTQKASAPYRNSFPSNSQKSLPHLNQTKVKHMAWETAVFHRLHALRQREMKGLRRLGRLQALTQLGWTVAPRFWMILIKWWIDRFEMIHLLYIQPIMQYFMSLCCTLL